MEYAVESEFCNLHTETEHPVESVSSENSSFLEELPISMEYVEQEILNNALDVFPSSSFKSLEDVNQSPVVPKMEFEFGLEFKEAETEEWKVPKFENIKSLKMNAEEVRINAENDTNLPNNKRKVKNNKNESNFVSHKQLEKPLNTSFIMKRKNNPDEMEEVKNAFKNISCDLLFKNKSAKYCVSDPTSPIASASTKNCEESVDVEKHNQKHKLHHQRSELNITVTPKFPQVSSNENPPKSFIRRFKYKFNDNQKHKLQHQQRKPNTVKAITLKFTPSKENPPRFNCKFCGDVCSTSYDLELHTALHTRIRTSEEPFQCSNCYQCFAKRDICIAHINTTHNGNATLMKAKPTTTSMKRREEEIWLQCNICKVFLKTDELMISHVKQFHQDSVDDPSLEINLNPQFPENIKNSSDVQEPNKMNAAAAEVIMGESTKNINAENPEELNYVQHSEEIKNNHVMSKQEFSSWSTKVKLRNCLVNLQKIPDTAVIELRKTSLNLLQTTVANDDKQPDEHQTSRESDPEYGYKKDDGEISYINSRLSMAENKMESYFNVNEICSATPNSYICNICGKNFGSEAVYRRHTRLHETDDSLVCCVCNKQMPTHEDLLNHYTEHKQQSSLSSKTSSKLNLKPLAQSEIVYACHMCTKTFTSEVGYKSHMSLHAIPKTPPSINFTTKPSRTYSASPTKKSYNPITSHSEQDLPMVSFQIKTESGSVPESHSTPPQNEEGLPCLFCHLKFSSCNELIQHYLVHQNQNDSIVEEEGEFSSIPMIEIKTEHPEDPEDEIEISNPFANDQHQELIKPERDHSNVYFEDEIEISEPFLNNQHQTLIEKSEHSNVYSEDENELTSDPFADDQYLQPIKLESNHSNMYFEDEIEISEPFAKVQQPIELEFAVPKKNSETMFIKRNSKNKKIKSCVRRQRKSAKLCNTIKCSDCGAKFSYSYNLQRHMRNVHGSNADVAYSTSKEILSNSENFGCQLANSEPLNFEESSEEFNTDSVANLSVKSNNDSVYGCSFPNCRRQFSDLEIAKKHAKSHKKIFECPFCSSFFGYNYSLDRHIQTFHPNGENRTRTPLDVRINGLSSSTSNTTVDVDIDTLLGPESPENESHASFESNNSVEKDNNAITFYSNVETFNCSICKKECPTKKAAKMHELSHTPPTLSKSDDKTETANPLTGIAGSNCMESNMDSEAIFKCKFRNCEEKFLTIAESRSHERNHSKESKRNTLKTFPCTLCTHSYKQKSRLLRHLSHIHPGLSDGTIDQILNTDKSIDSSLQNDTDSVSINPTEGGEKDVIKTADVIKDEDEDPSPQCHVCTTYFGRWCEVYRHIRTAHLRCFISKEEASIEETSVYDGTDGAGVPNYKPRWKVNTSGASVVSDQSGYKCSVVSCAKKFINIREALDHQRSHNNFCYKCDSCGKSFSSWSSRSTHVMTCQPKLQPYKDLTLSSASAKSTTILYDVDPQVDNKSSSLASTSKCSDNEKIQTAQQNKETTAQNCCPHCPKKFENGSELYEHMTIHASVKYTCTICSITVADSEKLLEHVLKNHGLIKSLGLTTTSGPERQFQPPMEPSQQLQTTIQTVPFPMSTDFDSVKDKELSGISEEKHHICSYCNKKFRGEARLKLHMKWHTLPISCSFCSKRFPFNSNLQDHTNKYHNDDNDNDVLNSLSPKVRKRPCITTRGYTKYTNGSTSIPCDNCTETFSMRHKLLNHIKEHHPNTVTSALVTENETEDDSSTIEQSSILGF